MPEWCPHCHGLLPDGLELCPNCGKRIRSKRGGESDLKAILSISLYVLAFTILPILIIAVIGLICVNLGS